jgi:hypothetical protein
MSIYVSHPERSSCFAQRSGYGVEGPNTACTGINAARHSHDGTVQSEFAEASTHAGLTDPGSFDCVGFALRTPTPLRTTKSMAPYENACAMIALT